MPPSDDNTFPEIIPGRSFANDVNAANERSSESSIYFFSIAIVYLFCGAKFGIIILPENT